MGTPSHTGKHKPHMNLRPNKIRITTSDYSGSTGMQQRESMVRRQNNHDWTTSTSHTRHEVQHTHLTI